MSKEHIVTTPDQGSIKSGNTDFGWSILVEDLDDDDLMHVIEKLIKSTDYIEMENYIFKKLLQRNEPELLEDYQTYVDTAVQKDSVCSKLSFSRRLSVKSNTVSFDSKAAILEKLGMMNNKLSVKQKFELIAKEIQSIKKDMDIKNHHFIHRKGRMMCVIEELDLREKDLNTTSTNFNKTFFSSAPSQEIQNVPMKMYTFIDQWYKSARSVIDKLRLRTSSIKVQYFKLCNQLIQKEHIGKDLQKVDFEYLHIDNRHMIIESEKKLKLLFDLKQMNARINLVVTTNKEMLLRKMRELEKKENDLTFKENKILEYDAECFKISEDLDKARIEHDNAVAKMEIYEAPDMMVYLKNKAEIGVLKKNIKIWRRRKQIKDMALTAVLREMKSVNDIFTSPKKSPVSNKK